MFKTQPRIDESNKSYYNGFKIPARCSHVNTVLLSFVNWRNYSNIIFIKKYIFFYTHCNIINIYIFIHELYIYSYWNNEHIKFFMKWYIFLCNLVVGITFSFESWTIFIKLVKNIISWSFKIFFNPNFII